MKHKIYFLFILLFVTLTALAGLKKDAAKNNSKELITKVESTVEICRHCNGTGNAVCYHCKGTGRVKCAGCGGRGYNPYSSKRTTCTFCNGKGTQKCGICYGKCTLRCSQCYGRGTK